MKYTITVETEDEFERTAIINAVKNKLLIDGIYDDVFRPVIKYSDDEKQAEAFGIVWDKLSEYLDDN